MRYIVSILVLLSVVACVPGSVVVVRPNADEPERTSGNYVDFGTKLNRLPEVVYVPLQMVGLRGQPAGRTRQFDLYRYPVGPHNDMVRLLVPYWLNWYDNPVLVCRPDRRSYGAYRDAQYVCAPERRQSRWNRGRHR